MEKETDTNFIDGVYGWYDFMTWKCILYLISIPTVADQDGPIQVCEKKRKKKKKRVALFIHLSYAANGGTSVTCD